MTVWLVNNLARQIDGEYCFSLIEYAALTKEKAESYLASVQTQHVKSIPTPSGDIQCLVERAVIEVDIDE